MKLALIHHPHSGYNRRYPRRVLAAAEQAGIPCWQVTSREEIESALREIGAQNVEALIVNGGDGTVDNVVTCLRHGRHFADEPMLALLAGGTTNMIARDVGSRGRPEQALLRLAAAAKAGGTGERLQRVPLAILGTTAAVAPLGFFLAGGALPGLLRKVKEGLHARGFVGWGGEAMALLQAGARLMAGDLRRDPLMAPRPLSWTMSAASTKPPILEQDETVLYFITTLDRLVLGINTRRVTPNLRFVALRFPYTWIALSLRQLLRGWSVDRLGRNFVFREGQRIALQFEGDLVLDGEPVLIGPGPVSIEVEAGTPLTFWRI